MCRGPDGSLMTPRPRHRSKGASMRTTLVVALVALLARSSAVEAYDPPIGIPAPQFGIDETHRMYENATYDFGSGAMPYPNAGHGPYTHYVDNTHPNASNEDNPYGSLEKPRRDLFDRRSRTLKAGSVVEIHGGPYNYTGWRRVVSKGTAQRPVFLRAIGSDSKVRTQAGADQQHDLRIEGSYLVIENQEYYDGAYFRIWPESHHIAIRDCEIHNPKDRWISTGSVLSVGKSCKDVVAYRNHIHHNRRLKTPPDTPEDLHGVTIGAAAERVWILGNHIHHNSGDAFQASHRAIPAPRFVYVGGNRFHDDRENGVDLKSIQDVVVSQNVIYGYKPSVTSAGDAVVVGSNGLDPKAPYGPRRSWILFNEIRDSPTGIRVEGAADCWIVGNTIHELSGNGITLDIDSDSDNVNLVGNTIASVGGDGIHHHWRSGATNIRLKNNIISEVGGRHVEIGNGLLSEVSMQNCLFHQKGAEVAVRWGANRLTLQSGAKLNALPGCVANLVGDPDFVAKAGGNFRIQPSSAAIDKGRESKAYDDFYHLYSIDIKVDHDGIARPQGRAWDIGAFERPRK
jgi:parallel beta helix pectate lyase-like protein